MVDKPTRRYWADLPWTPRDLRAMLALVFSIVGAAVMTGFAGIFVYILWKGGWDATTAEQRIEWLGYGFVIVLVTVFAVLTALGMAINRRSFRGKAGIFEVEASGGSDDPPKIVTTTTVETDTKT